MVIGYTKPCDHGEKKFLEVAISCSKRHVSKKATLRNLAKRRIRAALQQLDCSEIEDIFAAHKWQGARCILVVDRACLTLAWERLRTDVAESIRKGIRTAAQKTTGEKNASEP